MLNAWRTCPKLCWHNLLKPIANSSPSKVCSYLDDQRKQSNIILLDSNYNTVILLIIIDYSLQFLERVSCIVSSLSEPWSTDEIKVKHIISMTACEFKDFKIKVTHIISMTACEFKDFRMFSSILQQQSKDGIS